jgi:hypothetical protein
MAAGAAPATFEPAFAADGVDELLVGFVSRRAKAVRAEVPTALSVQCSDADAAWVLRIGPDGVTSASTSASASASASGSTGSDADCSVRGAAADLYRALWNRAGPDELVVEGDAEVLRHFVDSVHVR